MRNKFLAGLALMITLVAFSSCATSKKYGCPTVSVESKKFKA
jgi:hypothetical protein